MTVLRVLSVTGREGDVVGRWRGDRAGSAVEAGDHPHASGCARRWPRRPASKAATSVPGLLTATGSRTRAAGRSRRLGCTRRLRRWTVTGEWGPTAVAAGAARDMLPAVCLDRWEEWPMSYGKAVREELRVPTRELRHAIPQVYAGYKQLHDSALAPGALDARTKELIALAIAVSKECDGCIAAHAHAAVQHGASPQEAAEAIGVTFLMNGRLLRIWASCGCAPGYAARRGAGEGARLPTSGTPRTVASSSLLATVVTSRRASCLLVSARANGPVTPGAGAALCAFHRGWASAYHTMASHAPRAGTTTMGMMMGAQNDPVMTGTSFPEKATRPDRHAGDTQLCCLRLLFHLGDSCLLRDHRPG